MSDDQSISTLRKRFTPAEDKQLKHVVSVLRIHNWEDVASFIPGRTARQCRDRYNNYLFKDISAKPWTPEEDEIILSKYKMFGSHWVRISKFLIGRSGNNVKNRWYKFLSKPMKQKEFYPSILKEEALPLTGNHQSHDKEDINCSNNEINLNFMDNPIEWDLGPLQIDLDLTNSSS